MNYNQFIKKHNNLLEQLMFIYGIIKFEKKVIKIDNQPDYDISKYERECPTDYYFANSFNFTEMFEFVIKFEFQENKLFHYDDFLNMSKELKIDFKEEDDCNFLLKLYKEKNEILEQHGFDTDIEQFKLHELRIQNIDNFNKKINYEGSFYGDNEGINPIDWGLYSFVEILGVPNQLSKNKFYKYLISESYILLQENKYKLAFFVGYSALESFINYEHSSAEEEKRLIEKLKELFKEKFGQIQSHQIYTSLINDFDEFTNIRNSIAHGRNPVEIGESEVRKLLQFTIILIISFDWNVTKFEEIIQ